MQSEKKKKKLKNRDAYEKLRKMLISGKFAQSPSWSLRSLAKNFNMSVVPVTEAVRRLEQEGILVVQAQRGITIKRLTDGEIRQANVIREALEIQAARIIARKHQKSKLAALVKIAKDIRKAIKQGKLQQAAYWDFQLHRKLVETADCEMLTREYDHIVTRCMLSIDPWSFCHFIGEGQGGPRSHLGLIQIVAKGDPEKAEDAVRKHIASDASN